MTFRGSIEAKSVALRIPEEYRVPQEIHDLIKRQSITAAKVAESYALPQRYMLGAPASAGTHDGRGVLDIGPGHLHFEPKYQPSPLTKTDLKAYADQIALYASGFTQQKETPMTVDRKNFALKAAPVKAEALAHKHLGSLVTVTLPSGAEITDILVGVHASHRRGDLIVDLENIRSGFEFDRGDLHIDPKSVVQVRRPRPVVKPKTARR